MKCSRCKDTAQNGHTMCKKHLAQTAEYGRAYREEHKKEMAVYGRERYQRCKNVWKHRANNSRYGLTRDQSEQIEKQRMFGNCEICGIFAQDVATSHGARGLHIDHDHITGKVRGLLCHRCNKSLGNMKDSPILLRKAAEYLEAYQ